MSAIMQTKRSPFTRHLWLTTILIVALAIGFTLYALSEKQANRAAELRFQSFLLADELRQSSDDLTRMVRTYVITGEPKYKKTYQDILDIRNGKKPRPGGYQGIYWDLVLVNKHPLHHGGGQTSALLELMRQAGFTEEELSKLTEAKASSDGLTTREFEAMKLVEITGPEAAASRTKARLMMYDDEYHQAKAAIMKPIDEFFELIDKRTFDAVQAAQTRALILRGVFIALGLGLMANLLRTSKVLQAMMGGSVDEVYAQIARIGHGDFSSARPVADDMKNSVQGWLAETQTKLNEIDCERREAAEALYRSETKFRMLYDSTSDAVMLLDEKGFFDCNRATLAMFGCQTREEFCHKHPADLSPPQQPCGMDSMLLANQMITTAMEKGSMHFDWMHKRNDTGQTFPAEVLLTALEMDGKPAIQAVVRDITARRRAEEAQHHVRSWQEGVNRILSLVLETIPFGEKLKRITDGIVETFGADFCRIWIIEKGDLCSAGCLHAETLNGPHVCRYRDKCLQLKASSGRYTHIDGKAHRRVPFGDYKIGRIASGEELKFLTNDVQHDSGVDNKEWAKSLGLVAFAGYRLRPPDGETLGVLALFAKFEISPDMEIILEGLSRALALVIQKDIATRDLENLKMNLEESLHREVGIYKTLAEKSFTGVFVIQDRLFAYITEQAANYYGYDVATLLGTKPDNLLFPEDEVSTHSMAVDMIKGKRTAPYEYRIVTKDNNIRWIMETVSPISFNGRPAILGNCIDITERRHREVQELHSQKLEAVGQLAAGIAHEINTPIQFVGDNLHFMKGAFQDIISLSTMLNAVTKDDLSNPADAKDILSRIHKKEEEIDIEYLIKEIPQAIQQSLDGLQRVSRIVLAMREFSHPGGEDKISMDINKAIESTITLARNEWKYSADLTTVLDPDLPTVMGYPADFNQVILNIIINAAQALQEKIEKEGGQKGRIEISTRQDGHEVEMCIRDTGPGIPQEVQSRIFDPFFTTKEVGKGTGQGLAIAHNIIVRKHGGKIHLETKVGEGTSFYIRLPLETTS